MQFLMNVNLNQNELQNAVIQPLATAPANAKEGQIYYNSSDKSIYQYNGASWGKVGVVYENVTDDGKVITGLTSTGGVTTTDVKNLKLKGITAVEGGYVADNMTLEQAMSTLDTAIKNAVAGSGEENQNAYSSFKVGSTTVTATSKTDTFEVAAGNNVTVEADSVNKKITIGATVPTKTSELTNDSDYVADANYVHSDNNYTTEDKNKLNSIAMDAEVNVQSDWDVTDSTSDAFIKNKPTSLSDFTNDEGFIDNTVSNLANYYLKTETYSKTELDQKVAELATIKIETVEQLPDTGSSNIIYLVAKTGGATNNQYEEYVWTGSAFEKIGDTTIDLSNYLQKDDSLDTTTVNFTTATTRANVTSGDTMAVLMGKIAKYFGDLGDLAFKDGIESADLPSGSVVDEGYQKFRTADGTIVAGGVTANVSFTGTMYSVETFDAVTNERVLCDVAATSGGAQISLAAAHANTINIRIIYVAS